MAALELHRIANEGKGLTQEEHNALAAMLQSLVAVLESSGRGNNEKGRVGHEPDHIGRRVSGEIGMPIVCNKSTSVIEPYATESVLASESVQPRIGNVHVDPTLSEPLDPIPNILNGTFVEYDVNDIPESRPASPSRPPSITSSCVEVEVDPLPALPGYTCSKHLRE